MKTCNHCRIDLPLDAFGQDSRRKDGRASTCRACARQQRHESYVRHREKVLEQTKAYQRAHPEVYRKSSRKYYWNNVDEKRRKASGWRKNNPVKYLEIKRRRYGRQGPGLRPSQLLAIWMAQDGLCLYCGSYTDLIEGHFDHRIPLAAGGETIPENLVWSCQRCNLSKATSLEYPLLTSDS